jgi:hypothetical protein
MRIHDQALYFIFCLPVSLFQFLARLSTRSHDYFDSTFIRVARVRYLSCCTTHMHPSLELRHQLENYEYQNAKYRPPAR